MSWWIWGKTVIFPRNGAGKLWRISAFTCAFRWKVPQTVGAPGKRMPWAGWDKGGGRGWKYHLVLHLAMYFSSDFKDVLNPLVVRSVLKRGLTACLRSGSLQPRSRAVQQGSGRCSGVRLYLSSQCRNGALATSCQGRTELCLPGSYITFILMVIFRC